MNKHLTFFFLLLCMVCAQAADKYVRKGATGTASGADWTNAYTDFNQVTTAGLSGFTIYIAAGTYTGNFPAFASVNNWNLKRATIADHGTSTGWSNSYDGQVTHNGGKFIWLQQCSNVVIDGGGTKEPWLFTVNGHNSDNGKVQFDDGSNITFRYIDMNGGGCPSGTSEDGFRIGGITNVILEHNWIRNYYHCDTGHADAIQMPSATGAIIRYNKFQDSGMLLFVGDCDWGNQWVNNLHVHHNIFIQHPGIASNYRLCCFKGVGQTSTTYNIWESNTFYSVGFSGGTFTEDDACAQAGTNTTRRVFRNNIFAPNAGMPAAGIGGASSGWNNSFGGGTVGSNGTTSNPLFVSTATDNYRLQAGSPAADTGTSTALGYGDTITVDYDGNPVGATRSRGAFEPAVAGDPFPVVLSSSIPTAGTSLSITFSENVNVTNHSGFVLSMNGGAVTLPAVSSGSGTSTLTFSPLSRTIGSTETGTLSYTTVLNGIEDSTGQDLQSLSGTPVTNNSTVPTTAAVSFSPAAGSYFGTQNITLTSSTPANTIRYTTDGSTPTGSSTQYVSPIPVSASATITAFAAASGFLNSPITSSSYEVGTWSTVGVAWKTFAVPQQTGTFTWTFRASATSASQDGIIGLSTIPATTYTDLGPVMRFGPSGVIDAHQSGGTYAAVNSFTYVPGTTYEFVVTVNIAAKTYSATVSQIAGSPVVIATNYAFRSGAAAVTDLDNAAIYASVGGVTVSQMSFSGAATIPTLTSATVGSAGTTLTLGFSVPVSYGIGGSGGWTMSSTGGAVTLTPTPNNPTLFTTSRTIGIGQTGTISYVQPGNGVEASSGGGDLASLSGFAFNNQSTVDLAAPTPNPMTFSSAPAAPNSFSITMTASLATDASSPPVNYYFDEVSGNSGGTDSGWQASRTYSDTGLSPGIQYTYRVMARDSSVSLNQTTPSATFDAVTPIIAGGKVITPAKTNGAAILNP